MLSTKKAFNQTVEDVNEACQVTKLRNQKILKIMGLQSLMGKGNKEDYSK